MADKTFIVTDASLNEVSGTLIYDPGTQTATLQPASPLLPFTQYNLRITQGVKDIAGNAMASDFTSSFTTGNQPDVDPPTVIATSPGPGETGVSLGQAISATFSEPMDSSTLVG
jgi:hypothetical protein